MTRTKRQSDLVYVFDGVEHGVKIGISHAGGLRGRLYACQVRTGLRVPFAKTWDAPLIAMDVESYVKDMLLDHRIEGEWFRVSLSEMRKSVEYALDTYRRLQAAHERAIREGRADMSAAVHVLCGGSLDDEWYRHLLSQRQQLHGPRQAASA